LAQRAPGRTSWARGAPGTHLASSLIRSHLLSSHSLCLQVTSIPARAHGRAQRLTLAPQAKVSRRLMPSFQTLPTIREAKTKSSSNPRAVRPAQTSCSNWPLCDGTSLLRQKQSSPQSPNPLPFHGKPRTKWASGPSYVDHAGPKLGFA